MASDAPSFLVINVSRIGDTLLATPAIRAVAAAYPGASITVLAHPNRVEVIRALPFVSTVGTITKRSAPWRGRFGRPRYDYALVYGFDEPLVAYALRVAGKVVAFRQKDPRLNKQLQHAVDVPVFQSEHSARQQLRLPAALGIAPSGLRVAYEVTPHESRAARQRLASDIPAETTPLIGLQVASFPTKSYRDWPVENFASLAVKILERWPQAHFLIYGGNEETTRVRWLKQQLGARATLYAGKLTLRETGAIMSLTDLYLGVDTGPTHIMSAFDIPLVGLYHCLSSSRLTGPLEHPQLYAIDHPQLGHECTEVTPMADITVESVLDKVGRALREHPPATAARRFA